MMAHGTYQTIQDAEHGLYWWVCSCGITAAHGRASRRGARRDGDKHIGRAVTNRPSRRERTIRRAGAPASSAGGPAQAIALASAPHSVAEKQQSEIELKSLLQPESISPGKPLVLVWHGDESD